MLHAHNTQLTSLKKAHEKIRTAKVIYHAILNILMSLTNGTEPTLQIYYDSNIEQFLQQAWEEQRAIRWD